MRMQQTNIIEDTYKERRIDYELISFSSSLSSSL